MTSILDHLTDIFFQVRQFLLSNQASSKTVGKNPKGDNTKEFDFETEKRVIDFLLKNYPNSRILTEEVGLINESIKDFDYLFVIDPVDGSANFERGIPMVGFSVAVLDGSEISTDKVTHAFIGHIYSGNYFKASKGKGSFIKEEPIRQKDQGDFLNRMVTCSINKYQPEHFTLFQSVNRCFRQVRSFGSSTIEFGYVLQGVTTAHYDFRKKTTAENFLAAALILEEMGGKLTDLRGEPIRHIEGLVEGYSHIASHNADEHLKFIDILKHPELYS